MRHTRGTLRQLRRIVLATGMLLRCLSCHLHISVLHDSRCRARRASGTLRRIRHHREATILHHRARVHHGGVLLRHRRTLHGHVLVLKVRLLLLLSLHHRSRGGVWMRMLLSGGEHLSFSLLRYLLPLRMQ